MLLARSLKPQIVIGLHRREVQSWHNSAMTLLNSKRSIAGSALSYVVCWDNLGKVS